ncbi:molybdopterin-dependent oxidoreductase [Nocardioidaceae bacterium]|nr:molybdopterin-dependent oxidoreductase [Nocardioidaceae bacterium]
MDALGPLLHGGLTAVAALGAAEAAAWWTGADSPVDDAARIAVDLSPHAVVEETVRRLGTADKPAVRASAALGVGAALALAHSRGTARRLGSVGALVGLDAYAARRHAPRRTPRAHMAVGGAAGATALAVHGLGAVPAALTAAAGATAWRVTHRARATRLEGADARLQATPLTADEPLAPLDDGAHRWPGLEPLPTTADALFATDVNLRPPLVDAATWRLRVTGHVERELDLDLASLEALGTVEADVALVCIHTRPGWLRQGTPRWVGVPLRRVLEAAGVMPGAVDLRSVAVDGFAMRHGIGQVRAGDALVVIGMDGHRLTPAHGAPARLLVPGLYGQYAGVKWLTELQVTDARASFYWESRGFPVAVQGVRPSSRIDAVGGVRVPVGRDGRTRGGAAGTLRVGGGRTAIVGSAWAPCHDGVGVVEVRADEGTWRPAELAGQISPYAQRRWRVVLDLEAGDHELQVRMRAADGTVQAVEPSAPGMTGATGLHRLRVRTS